MNPGPLPKKIFGRGGARCPVELYKKYRSHRVETMLDNESPFYLGIKGEVLSNDNVWYKASPMGKNIISQDPNSLKHYTTASANVQREMLYALTETSGEKREKRKAIECPGSKNKVPRVGPMPMVVPTMSTVPNRPPPPKKNMLEKVVASTSSMLSGAIIHGHEKVIVNLNMMSSQNTHSNVNMSRNLSSEEFACQAMFVVV